jgi:chromosome segregation ATPase
MSDPNKYINYYVENALGMVHEYVNLVLQSKTQARVTQEQLQEKDLVIAQLTEQVEKNKLDSNQLSQAAQNARSWEDQYNTMKNKVTHMDTLTTQFNDLKNQFVDRNNQIQNLNQQVDSLKSELNTKNDLIKTTNEELEKLKSLLAEKEAKLDKLTKSAERKAAKEAKTSAVTATDTDDNSPKKVINTKITSMPKVDEKEQIDDF